MSILNRPSDGLVSALIALRRAIIAYGPQTGQQLIELCAPDGEGMDGAGLARKTLTRWRQLGVFEEQEDGKIALAPIAQGIEADDLKALRFFLLRTVLAAENNPNLAEDRGDEEAQSETSRCTDFSRAASWALSQDPYSFATSFQIVERVTSEQRIAIRLFSNSTRWNGFIEWAHFLGIGIQSKGGLLPNPFIAVQAVLTDVFRGARELNQETFLSRLSDALPIIDGGQYSKTVETLTDRPWRKWEQNELSPCLSLALKTLSETKMLRLESRSDASQRILLGRGAQEDYSFSHVVHLRPV